MPFPARLLDGGEHVVLYLRPHWRRLGWPLLLVPVVAAVTSYLAFELSAAARLPVLLGALVVLGLGTLRPVLRWVTSEYVVTDRRMIVRTGVLTRTHRDLPLTRVNDVSLRRTLLERLLGCGTLTVMSAGELGGFVLPDVPHAESVQRELHRLIDAAERHRGGVAG